MPESNNSGAEAFGAWCEELAARKSRNAVPGEPAAPMVNAILVSTGDLIDAFQAAHPEHASSRAELEAFATDYGAGLEVDKGLWKAQSHS